MATLISRGPQSVWYSPDGTRFSLAARLEDRPNAPGAYRPDAFTDTKSGAGIRWGISMVHHRRWPHLLRFECNLNAPPRAE